MTALQFLAYHIGVSPMTIELFSKPLLMPVEHLCPSACSRVGQVAAGAKIATHGVATHSQFSSDTFAAPAPGVQTQHYPDLLRFFHLSPLTKLMRGSYH
jgi:hypothetical protein